MFSRSEVSDIAGTGIKMLYGRILTVVGRTLGEVCAKKFDTYLRFRRRLDLDDPQTLADKVCFIEIFRPSPLKSRCTDKYAVRDYVRQKGLGGILIPLVGGPWENAHEVDFDHLPGSFVIKATHGCKMNCIVEDKSVLDVVSCRRRMERWLRTEYGAYSAEPHYRDIPRRLYAETCLGAPGTVVDYKFHCFNGRPCFVLVCSDRKTGTGPSELTLDTFDMEWRPVFQMRTYEGARPGSGNIARPDAFDQMCMIARKLSEDFDFVRVDLYEQDGRVYFGELTFTPACGVFPYYTDAFLREMGERLNVSPQRRGDRCE